MTTTSKQLPKSQISLFSYIICRLINENIRFSRINNSLITSRYLLTRVNPMYSIKTCFLNFLQRISSIYVQILEYQDVYVRLPLQFVYVQLLLQLVYVQLLLRVVYIRLQKYIKAAEFWLLLREYE